MVSLHCIFILTFLRHNQCAMISISLDIHIDFVQTQSMFHDLSLLHIHIDIFETQPGCHDLHFISHSYWHFEAQSMCHDLNFTGHSYSLFWDTINMLWPQLHRPFILTFLRHNQCAMISTSQLIHSDFFEA